MDYKNEFEGIVKAVKSEMQAQKNAQKLALQGEESFAQDSDADSFENLQSSAMQESDYSSGDDSLNFTSSRDDKDALDGQNFNSQDAQSEHLRASSDRYLRAAGSSGDDGRSGDAAGGNFKTYADAASEIYDRLGSEIDAQDFVHDLPLNFIKSSPLNSSFDSEQEEISAQNFAGFKELGESGYESFDDDFKEFGEIRSSKNYNAQDFKFSAPNAFPSARDYASAQNFGTAKNATDDSKTENEISSEAEFLNALKERILVLFEGLNAFDQGDIEARVELNLKFMEFLLASIDDRLEHLSKR